MSESLDRLDRKILAALSRDCRASIADIGTRVGLSTSACHRRIKLLEEAGVITGYVATLDPGALGRGMEAFVEISLAEQSDAVLTAFERAIENTPEILECHLMSGRADYLLRLAVADPADYERIHRRTLSSLPGVSRIYSSFSLKTIRPFRGYAFTDRGA